MPILNLNHPSVASADVRHQAADGLTGDLISPLRRDSTRRPARSPETCSNAIRLAMVSVANAGRPAHMHH